MRSAVWRLRGGTASDETRGLGIARQAALLLIVGWLPGAVLFRIPVLERHRRAALDAEERTFWSVILSVVLSLSGCLALAAAGEYSFQRLVIADALVAAAGALLWRGRLRMHDARRVTLTALVPVLLVGLGLWRFFPSSEYIIGGRDPGVYMNEGIQIAQRGALVIQDETVAAVPPFARDLFLPQHLESDGTARRGYYGLRFMGFLIRDPDRGLVIGQFPHLFPASIAIAYGVDGLTGARRTPGVWAVLGLLAVYFAGARLVGKPAAAIAAGLLSLHVIDVWFAKYPNAEVLMQTLVFAAVLANARAHVDDDPFFAPVAGGLLGVLLFLRFDAVLAIAGVAAGILAGILVGRRVRAGFIIAFAIPAVLAAVYLTGPMRAYFEAPYVFGQRLYLYAPWWQWMLLIVAAGALVFVVAAARRRAQVREVARVGVPVAAAIALAAGATYALFFRHPGGRLTDYDAYALRTFADLYFTLPALLAAVLGYALMAKDRFWRDPALFLTVAVFAFFVFYKIRIVPEHFWMSRRFLAVILPGALLFLSAAAFASATHGWRARIVRWTLGGTLIALAATTYLRTSRPLLDHVEYEGLIPHIESLASRFSENDLLVLESRNAGGDMHVLATPLAYIYARNVLLLNSPRPDKSTLAMFVDWARTRYTGVYYLGGAGTDLLSYRYSLSPVATERFGVPEYESTTDALPRVVNRKDFELGIYRFGDARPDEAGAWFALDVGTNDDLHVLRFHARERTEGRTFRWTGAQSFVSVTTVPEHAAEVTLVLSDGGRPPAAPPARVDVYFHRQHLGTIDVARGGFRPYALRIPKDLAARAAAARDPVELRLVVETWNPQDVIGAPDDRHLGVMLDRVTVK